VKRTLILLAALAPVVATTLVPAPAHAATEAVDATALARAIASDPDTVVSAELLNPVPTIGTTGTSPAVRADQPLAGFPRAGATYAALSNGYAAPFVAGAPSSGDTLDAVNDDGPGLHGSYNFDTTVLRVDADVPADSNCVSVDLLFATNEPSGFVQEGFVFEVGMTTWQTNSDQVTTTASDNAANGSDGKLLTVDSPEVTATVPAGIPRAEASRLLTASSEITPGIKPLYFSIFDEQDRTTNSDVLLDNLRFTHVADPATQCQKGAKPAITNVAAPVVQGTPSLGGTLTATTGTWTPTGLSHSYQWLRDGTPISGATAKTYAPATSDVGHQLRVRVTASNGSSLSATSAPTGAVTQPTSVTVLEELRTSQPTIKGKAKVGRVLTARPGAWGPGTVTFAYQWYRGEKAIRGARAATYTITRKDRGKSLHVVVTGSEPGFVTVTRTSPSTKEVKPG
jgi:hypothetical protein